MKACAAPKDASRTRCIPLILKGPSPSFSAVPKHAVSHARCAERPGEFCRTTGPKTELVNIFGPFDSPRCSRVILDRSGRGVGNLPDRAAEIAGVDEILRDTVRRPPVNHLETLDTHGLLQPYTVLPTAQSNPEACCPLPFVQMHATVAIPPRTVTFGEG